MRAACDGDIEAIRDVVRVGSGDTTRIGSREGSAQHQGVDQCKSFLTFLNSPSPIILALSDVFEHARRIHYLTALNTSAHFHDEKAIHHIEGVQLFSEILWSTIAHEYACVHLAHEVAQLCQLVRKCGINGGIGKAG